MRFAALSYVHLLWLLPALLALYVYGFARKRRVLSAFVDPSLAPRLTAGLSRSRRWLKALCLLGAVAAMIAALTQPQWGRRWQDVQRRGRDVMILLDVSRSMLAEDVSPNRLEGAKMGIRELVQVMREEGGHRLGLVVFAGRASLQCPLTLDTDFFLRRLQEVGPHTAGRGGSLIGDAIRHALRGMTTLAHHYKDIILITDGDDHDSFPLEAAASAAEQGVAIYAVGVGDSETGARIPVRGADGRVTYLEHQGREVRSRLRHDLLLDMAQMTGGAYVPAGTRAIELERIFTEHIAPKARQGTGHDRRERFVHRFQWFVLAALGLLALELFIPESAARDEA